MKTFLLLVILSCPLQDAFSQGARLNTRLHQTVSNSDEEFDSASLPEEARAKINGLHPGLKRSEVEKIFDSDGGILWGWRYFLRSVSVRNKQVVLELDFQPAGMPDDVYGDVNRAAIWRRSQKSLWPQPDDVLRSVGKPFLADAHF